MFALSREERSADRILKEFWSTHLPVDPEAIAVSLGATVQDLGRGAESGAFKLEGDRASIFVNRAEPVYRQRFTIAHEIGHWVLGHGPAWRDTVSNFMSSGVSAKEREANAFAACLLMPRVRVVGFVENSRMSIDDMARVFFVSRAAMDFRLRNLGLVSNS